MFSESKYNQLLNEIYTKFPSFQVVGGKAIKYGLDNMHLLDKHFGNPSQMFKSVHVAGTNGKGSVSSMIASALMELGYEVGLYTSPHLVDFRERIKINGDMIPKEWVHDFLEHNKELFEQIGSSFFEITTSMAFCYFVHSKVDIAVIECGLGGRLDSTNIITPTVSVITNIGLDHCQYLGSTHLEIATEKAGIIKPGTPVVIGEKVHELKNEPFESISRQMRSPIFFAEDLDINESEKQYSGSCAGKCAEEIYSFAKSIVEHTDMGKMDLKGGYQNKNIKTAALALSIILNGHGNDDSKALLIRGIEQTAHNTKLRGRWEKLCHYPLIICDIGHNEHGLRETMPQVIRTYHELKEKELGLVDFYIIFGVMKDKDLEAEIPLLPKEATYFCVQASSERAKEAKEVEKILKEHRLNAITVGLELKEQGESNIASTLDFILKRVWKKDFIFVGGSSYVVAEAIKFFDTLKEEMARFTAV